MLCAVALGHDDLGIIWENSHPGVPVEVWEHGRDSLRERIEHVNLVVRFGWSLDERLQVVLIAMPDLGWFAPRCDGGVLHD